MRESPIQCKKSNFDAGIFIYDLPRPTTSTDSIQSFVLAPHPKSRSLVCFWSSTKNSNDSIYWTETELGSKNINFYAL